MTVKHTNLNIIDDFVEAYARNDLDAIRQVVSENVKWIFPGRNPLSGTKVGIGEVLEFFDKMSDIMGKSNIKVEKLVMGASENYLVECQHIWTNREDGINLDHQWCVLWKFEHEKIIEGKHFASDQYEVDRFLLGAY